MDDLDFQDKLGQHPLARAIGYRESLEYLDRVNGLRSAGQSAGGSSSARRQSLFKPRLGLKSVDPRKIEAQLKEYLLSY